MTDEIDSMRCYHHPRWGHAVPCPAHAAEARAAADAAEKAMRESCSHVPAKREAMLAGGARTYAYQHALDMPLTPCSDGGSGLGWYDDDGERLRPATR